LTPTTTQSQPLPQPSSPTLGVTLGAPKAPTPKNSNASKKAPITPPQQDLPPTSDEISIETPGVKTLKTKQQKNSTSPTTFEFGSFKTLDATTDLESLPKSVQIRIKALQKLQHTHAEHEKDFLKELKQLESKYERIYAPLYEKKISNC